MSEALDEDRRPQRRLAAITRQAPARVVSDPVSRFDPFPLTDVQRAYWIGRGEYFELGNVGCHVYLELTRPGLDHGRLEAAWQQLIDRHDMLRAIVREDGLQQILPQTPDYKIRHHDLDPANMDSELEAIRHQLSHQLFPANQWPMFELRTSEQNGQTVLHLSIDLLLIDAWSMQILLDELLQLTLNPGARLPAIAIGFRDYLLATTQRESASYSRSEDYWRQRLETLPPAPALPLARDPLTITHPRFVRRDAVIEPGLWEELKVRCVQANISPAGTLLTAFSRVLAAWSESPHFTLNTTLLQRESLHPDVARLVGDFTGILLLEVHEDPSDSFSASARKIAAQFRRDLRHRRYGGVRVLQDIAKRGDAARPPLMPVVFTSAVSEKMPGWKLAESLKIVHGVSQTPQVYLDCQVIERAGRLEITWDAVEELFPAGLLDDMFGVYCGYLRRLAQDEAAWSEPHTSLLPPAQSALRAAVNDTAAAVPAGLLHEPFLEQVRVRPLQPAVITTERRLSYRDVHQQARRLARQLRSMGVAPNRLVAVVMEKGWEQVVAVIAILEAGAAYLPVDPDLPRDRRWLLLERGGVEIVVTQPCVADRLEWPTDVRCVSVDWQEVGAEEDDEPRPPTSGRDLAYVIFTSGSTGEPKGVMIEHGSALNTILDINERFGVGADDRILALSSLSFDLSVYDIFGALAAGATIVLPHATSSHAPGDWADLVLQEQVTIWNSVPALLELMVDHVGSRKELLGNSLRLALLSGDWIPLGLPDRARACGPGMQVVSLGGATEASIWSIFYPVSAVGADWKSIPYGRALRNQQMHVLNEAMLPCPTWVPGQIYIGGVGLARGYWGDEAKTRAQFVNDARSGERLYRTGDLGRHLPDGNIEFLGREDHQVKVQGYRIELGEIEAALERHPKVKSAVVTAVGERSGPKHLAAYVVAPAVTSEELADHLRQTLPGYMVPAVWQQLDALPLSANGKVNRKALPAPAMRADPLPPAPADQSDVLARMTALLSEELALASLDPHNNLLALGATSMDLVRIVGRLQKEFNFRPSFQQFLRNPSAAALADLYRQSNAVAAKTNVTAVARPRADARVEHVPDPASRHEPFPLTDVQKAYWLGRGNYFELGNIGCHVYLEIELPGVDRGRLQAAWQQLIDRHEMLRAIVREDGLQQVLPHTPRYEIKHLSLRGANRAKVDLELEALRRQLSHQVFAPDRWPLFDLRTSDPDGETVLHLSCDLMFVDFWSMQILLNELVQLSYDPDCQLQPLAVSFRDYMAAAAQQQDSASYRRSEEYWRQRLDTLPPAPRLPLARSPSTIRQPSFCRRRAMLEGELWQDFKNRSAKANVTPTVALMAAFARVLAAWSESPSFSLNVTLFNRVSLHPDVARLVGDFTGILLLEVREDPKDSFETLARRLAAQFWNDLEHHEYGGLRVLHDVAQRGDPDRKLSMPVVFTSALSQVMPGLQSAEHVGKLKYGVSQTPQVWLDHQVYERAGELHLTWDAVEELFPAGLLDDMFGVYCGYLRRLAQDEAAWSEPHTSLLPPAQSALRAAVNDTATAMPSGLLHEPFLEQVRVRPLQPAVITTERCLSYRDVHQQARRLARQLRSMGVAPNRLVAVVMEKGWEQVVAVIAILEAGAAYLPVDPDLPRDRRWLLLERGEVEIVVTQPCVADRLEWPTDVRCVSVDWQDVGAEEDDEPRPPTSGRDLAYVIFTSGSTGEPKGVMIEHGSALNTILDINERFGVGADDRILALSSLSFDLSVYDIFGALAAGATIVLPHPTSSHQPGDWADLVLQEQVTIWNSVPALLELMVDHVGSRKEFLGNSLRLALLSGDWIPLGLPDRARACGPGMQVVSLGGATEASIWSIFYPVSAVGADWKSIPYGRALRNQQMHVLNEAMLPCPTWVPGQIYIGGVGLARGYWGDEAKTRAQFVNDARSGERLYRTGDLGRYLPDGNIEFLGREDHQVKVQGYRIELGEIEAALERHPKVKSAVVTAVGERSGPKHLAAYVVAPAVTSEELADHLRQTLPGYMVPAVWQQLDALPLSANGKVNRKALPAPVLRADPLPPAPADQSDVLARMTALLSEELALASLDPHNNLLALGATSMDLVRIVGRLQKEFNFRPSFQQFLRDPSPAALADLYRQNTTVTTRSGVSASAAPRLNLNLVLDPAAKEEFRRDNSGIRVFPTDWGRLRLENPGRANGMEERMSRRRAVRRFRSEPVPLASLGALLAELSQMPTEPGGTKYGYGSAGGLYPVQTYLHAKPDGVASLPSGTFYYHPVEHALVPIALGAELGPDIHEPFINRPIFQQARFSLFLVHQPRAIEPIYGDLAWRFSVLEAGAMAHALETLAWRFGLGLCPIGWLDFSAVRGLLQLEDGQELLHAHVGGLAETAHEVGHWEEGVV